MPSATSEYRSVSLNEAARTDLCELRDEIVKRGTSSLPNELAALGGQLTVSDIVRLGMRALRDRMRGVGIKARGGKVRR